MNTVLEAESIYKSKTKDFGLLAKAFLHSASGNELIEYIISVTEPGKFAYLVRNHLIHKIKNFEINIGAAAQRKLLGSLKSQSSKAAQFHAKNLFDIFGHLSNDAQMNLFKLWVFSEKPIERIKGYNSFALLSNKKLAEKFVFQSTKKYSDRRGIIQLMLHGDPRKLNKELSPKLIWSAERNIFSWRVKQIYLKRLIEKIPRELNQFQKISFLTYLVGCAHIKMDPGNRAVLNWIPKIKDKKELRITLFCLGKSGNKVLLRKLVANYSALEQKLPEQYLDPVRRKKIIEAVAKYESEVKKGEEFESHPAAV